MCSKDKIIQNAILILPTVVLEIKFMFTLQPLCSMLLCIKSVRNSDFFFALKFLLNDSCCSPELNAQLQLFYFPTERVFGSMPNLSSLNFNTASAGSCSSITLHRMRQFLPPQFSSSAPQPFPFQAQREIIVHFFHGSRTLSQSPKGRGASHIYTLLILCENFLGSQPKL